MNYQAKWETQVTQPYSRYFISHIAKKGLWMFMVDIKKDKKNLVHVYKNPLLISDMADKS